MCETLQLNWKLPITPVDVISSPLSVVKKSNTCTSRDNTLRQKVTSRKMNQIRATKNQKNCKKENSNNNHGASVKQTVCKIKKNSAMLIDSCNRELYDKEEGKYILRECSLKKRKEIEVKKSQPKKRGPKPRPKPQPMSKYRRKTANLRERERMGEINTAFENLKEKIPTPLVTATNGKPCANEKRNRCEKQTKINVLHIAINYIRALESILDTGDAGVQVYGTSIVQSPRLSGPNYLVDELTSLKENKNISQEFQNNQVLNSSSLVEKKPKLPIIQTKCARKYNGRPNTISGTQNILVSRRKQKKIDEFVKCPIRKKSKSKKQISFHKNICDQLNQLQPVKPSKLLIANSTSTASYMKKNEFVCNKQSEMEYDDEHSKIETTTYCPDWTELTPTLEFPPITSNHTQRFKQAISDSPNEAVSILSNIQYPVMEKGNNLIEIKADMTEKVASPILTKATETEHKVSYVSGASTTSIKSEQMHGFPPEYQSADHSGNHSPISKYEYITTKQCAPLPDDSIHLSSPLSRGNLDTLLSLSAHNSHEGESNFKNKYTITHNNMINSFAHRRSKTASKIVMPTLNCDLSIKTTLPWLNNSPSPPIFGRQPSFPDVFGAADDPDFLFGEITKSNLVAEEALFVREDQTTSTYVPLSLASFAKPSSVSSGSGSVTGSDGGVSSSDENEITIMDFLNDTFQISI